MITSKISQWYLSNRRVFLRVDLNVPIVNEKIIDTFRISAILPTLNFIIDRGGSIVLATHLGRPKDEESHLSTKILIPWFKGQGYDIIFVPDFHTIENKHVIPRQIALLENLRFYRGETNGSPLFAKQLAKTAHYYINDAFGALHNTDTSISLLPYEFSQQKRSIGFLVEKELSIFDSLKKNPQHPFIAILGGGKIKDKIPLIRDLITIVDSILLCPALVFSFLKAQNFNVGKSLIDENSIEICKDILLLAQNNNISIIFPQDYQIAHGTFEGPLSTIKNTDFSADDVGISIGPKTVAHFSKIINEAKTIFFNGAMGFSNRPQTRESTNSLLMTMAHASGTTIVAGGDTVSAAINLNVAPSINHVSTGGGAALTYLGNKMLPGLMPFEEE